jgi:hypothetical protein
VCVCVCVYVYVCVCKIAEAERGVQDFIECHHLGTTKVPLGKLMTVRLRKGGGVRGVRGKRGKEKRERSMRSERAGRTFSQPLSR